MVIETEPGEAEKMRQVPGIIFVDGAVGRRARVFDGLDVFEIIKEYRIVGCDQRRLAAACDWLSDEQIHAAFAFYEAFPAEIDERLALENAITPETLYEQYPFMRPPTTRQPRTAPFPADDRAQSA